MADIGWAMLQVADYKMVRRKAWLFDVYIRLDRGDDSQRALRRYRRPSRQSRPFHAQRFDLLADDWELYEPTSDKEQVIGPMPE